jgi:putative transposase
MNLLEREDSELSISKQAELLSLNRSSLYYKPKDPSIEEVMIKHAIDQIYTQCPFYGSRRITAQLKRNGFLINRKATQRHMREMGICGIGPGPNLSKREKQHQIYPYLLRGVVPAHPNHVWSIDVTYIRLQRNWMYLVAIMDWYSRYIVAWELDQTLAIDFVLEALRKAWQVGQPLIFNSDQGSHFTSHDYLNCLKERKIQISMDGKGRALDNVFIERFWRSLKYEEVYPKDYLTPKEARKEISNYIDLYNHERPHQSLNYCYPVEFYKHPMVNEV